MSFPKNLTLQSKVKLASGKELPVLGFGVWQVPNDQAQAIVLEALKSGYRHIDSAAAYGNEAGCGAAIAEAEKTLSIPRSEIFFTSKVPPIRTGRGGRKRPSYEDAYAVAAEQVDKTLRLSKLEYVDLMLLHAPYGGSESRRGAWAAISDKVREGKVRSVGVSNYGVKHLDELEGWIKDDVPLSVGQWEIHPFCPRDDIRQWCAKRGVVVEAYSPLVRGERFDDPRLKKVVGDSLGGKRSAAQVLVRWSLQSGCVPLPKTGTLKRVKDNADVFGWELGAEDMKTLETGEYSPVCWDPTISELDE